MADEEKELDAQVYGNATAILRYEPKVGPNSNSIASCIFTDFLQGVIGALSPFNFPFELSLGPLCEQLAAG